MSDGHQANHADPGSLENVLLHLRNKQIDVFPTRSDVRLRVLNRLYRQVARARARTLKRACQVVVSEQVVEIPLVLRYLRPGDNRVLDFGGFESLLPLSLAALGHRVTVLDQRAYPFAHPGLRAECRDLFAPLDGLERDYDAIVSVSTIEHLGLGGYGEARREEGDRIGVERLWSLLRPGGRLLATVPAGQAAIHAGYRVYDQRQLHRVFPHLSHARWFRKDGRGGVWHEAEAGEVEQLRYQAPDASLPVEAVAFVICDKP